MSDAPPPPGWYPDPQRPGGQRWWDGTVWTAHVSAPAAPATPEEVPSDSRNWAVIAHLSAIAAALVALAFLGPLIVFLVKKDSDPFVRNQAAEALNFQLSALLYGFLFIISLVLIVGIALVPVAIVGAIAWLVLPIIAAWRSSNGDAFRYPLTIRFIT